MKSHPWIAVAVSLGSLAALSPATPQSPVRYRLDLKSEQVIDLTSLGQTEQRLTVATTGFVTLTARDSADGETVEIVLDSLQVPDSSPIPADQAKSAQGAKWRGFRQANGRMKDLALVEENPVAGAVTGILQQLLPPMKKGTREGQSWTDTTDSEANGGLAVRTVTNFQTSAESYQGQKVIRLAGASSSAISGTQQGPQGSIAITGTGNSTTAWFVAPDGACLGSNYTGTQSLQLSGSFAPTPLPVKITTEGHTSLIK